ncbi:MAG: hypothetical protein ACF8PN_02150 [Phycisphaerales bacterium]
MAVRLGELLVRFGALTEQEVQRVLDEQQDTGRPFGEIAERRFGLSSSQIEAAWAEQFAQITQRIDPQSEEICPQALQLVNRRQAWQFQLLPIRRDGREFMVATTVENLPRAARFFAWRLGEPVYFVLCDDDALEAALRRHYPIEGMTLRPTA